MKKILTLIFTSLITLQVFSIDIVDIFYLVPTNIDIERKKELVDFYNHETAKINESEREMLGWEFINVIDKTNGFLSLSTTGGDGGIEICYWKRENGNKIIAVYQVGYATSKFTQTINFYLLKMDSVLTKLDSDIIVPYKEIRIELLKNELTEKLTKEAKQYGLFENEAVVFELPRFGKVVKAEYGTDNSDNWHSRLLKNETCELIWDDLKLKINK